MNAAAIIIIGIAATGVLMMRFRKRWLAKINMAFTARWGTRRYRACYRGVAVPIPSLDNRSAYRSVRGMGALSPGTLFAQKTVGDGEARIRP